MCPEKRARNMDAVKTASFLKNEKILFAMTVKTLSFCYIETSAEAESGPQPMERARNSTRHNSTNPGL